MASLDGIAQETLAKRTILSVVFFSFFKLFSPLLSYTVPYLVEEKGFSNFEVTSKIFPISTYGSLFFTLLAAPACHYLSYKRVINICSFATLTGLLVLRFGKTLVVMEIKEILSSAGSASTAVFQAYTFFLVTSNHFQKLTSINQGTICMSVFLSAELSQILVLMGFSYNLLLYINVGTAMCACIVGLFLQKEQKKASALQPFLFNVLSKDQGFWSILKETWNDRLLRILSIWWAAAVAGFELSLNYGTNLFEGIDSSTVYNGQVIAIATASAVLSAWSSAYLTRIVVKTGGMFYILGCAIFGALCFTMGFCRSLYIAYPAYIAMLAVEKLTICILYAQCASLIKNANYMLLFSFNSGMSQMMVVLLQVSIELAQLNVFDMYVALGGYFTLIAIVVGILFGLNPCQKASATADAPADDRLQLEKQPLIDNHVLD